jgi:hypothetical protein
MPMKFQKGDQVVQVTAPIRGEVVSVAIVDDAVQFEVSYPGEDGEQHSRFFTEDQIEQTTVGS